MGIGGTSSYGGRNTAVNKTIRDVTYAEQNIQLGKRDGAPRRLDEILVRTSLNAHISIANEFLLIPMLSRYRGMSHSSQSSSASTRALSPQPTGFSQIHSRGGGEGGGQTMSILLSWHEKLVEIAGAGCIVRVMTDRRTV